MTTLVRHYDAATAPRGVLRHLLPLLGYPALIWQNRYLVHNFFRRELLARFRGTALGALWILVQPLFLFAVYYMVFGMLFGDWRRGEMPDPQMALYLFSGIIVFHALVEATGQSCTIVVENGNLVKKVAFPSEALVIHVVLVSLVTYLVGAVVCLLAGTAFGALQPGLLLLGLPLVLAVQLVFCVGLGLFLANLNVFARDVSQIWRIVTTAWLFLTPVFWRPSLMRDKFGDTIVADLLFSLNPAYPLVQAHRLALGGVHPDLGSFWQHLGAASLWAIGFLVVGYSTFMSRKHKYADLI